MTSYEKNSYLFVFVRISIVRSCAGFNAGCVVVNA